MNRLIIDSSDKQKIMIKVTQEWTKESLADTNYTEKEISNIHDNDVVFDFSMCGQFDSAGAVEIIRLSNKLLSSGCSITFIDLSIESKRLFIFYRKNFTKKVKITHRNIYTIEGLGRWFVDQVDGVLYFLSFLGESFWAFIRMVLSPTQFRYTALFSHIYRSGIQALPIITLTSLLIGLVVAYQAAGYLVKAGADIFIVDLSVMSIFRELAPMITAIVIAGRSSSSYTAEIGTMKITEEIDAMRTMGFDPFVFLVLPRMFALFISMPLLIFAADMVGMLGTMIVAKFHLGISFDEFFSRLYSEVPIKHLYVGLAKAPIYGIIVSIIGCYRGFQVSGSTDSIGSFTTRSVVDSIFWIIMCDAAIAIMLTEMNI